MFVKTLLQLAVEYVLRNWEDFYSSSKTIKEASVMAGNKEELETVKEKEEYLISACNSMEEEYKKLLNDLYKA